jgi:fumarate reductase subunit C
MKTIVQYEKPEIVSLAKSQKLFIYLFAGIMALVIFNGFVSFGKNPVSVILNLLFPVAKLALGIWGVLVIYRLAKGLKEKRPVFYAVGMIIPLVNLLVIVSLFSKTTKVLRAQGLKVGLMGCHNSDLKSFTA